MGAAHDLVLYVRGNMTRVDALHRLLIEPMDGTEGQHFDRILASDEDLPGSGQAGAPTIYALSLRRGSTTAVTEQVKALFEKHKGPEAVLIVSGDYIMGPAEVHRIGYQPSSNPRDWL